MPVPFNKPKGVRASHVGCSLIIITKAPLFLEPYTVPVQVLCTILYRYLPFYKLLLPGIIPQCDLAAFVETLPANTYVLSYRYYQGPCSDLYFTILDRRHQSPVPLLIFMGRQTSTLSPDLHGKRRARGE
jgi:hypothetical protein